MQFDYSKPATIYFSFSPKSKQCQKNSINNGFEMVSKSGLSKSGLLIKSSRLEISELQNYFTKLLILIKKKELI